MPRDTCTSPQNSRSHQNWYGGMYSCPFNFADLFLFLSAIEISYSSELRSIPSKRWTVKVVFLSFGSLWPADFALALAFSASRKPPVKRNLIWKAFLGR